MHPRFAFTLLIMASLGVPGSAAQAYSIATTTDGIDLRWDNAEVIQYRIHAAGSDDLDSGTLQQLTRAAFGTWNDVPTADITFQEGPNFNGPAEHHAGPEDVDFESAVFFVEADWPYATEVIALTSVSFASDGEILDADIAFNGQDHTFTTVDQGGEKDFLSICTHEAGHFAGLDHPDPNVPEATMTAEYEDGDTFLRDLDPDDEAGLTFLYPLPEPEGCPQAACDGAGGSRPAAALVAFGLGLLLVGGRSRRRRGPGPALASCLALGLLVSPGSAQSTLVTELSIADLAAGADRVVLADVVSVQSHLQGIVRRTVLLDVVQDWAGGGSAQLSLELLGGELDEAVQLVHADGRPRGKPLKGTRVFGVPEVDPGERIVVVLSGGQVRGLAQGLFHVGPDGSVWRDLTGLALARTSAGPPLPVTAPGDLVSLKAALFR